MDRALIIAEPTDRGRELVEIAGEMAAGSGAELVLLRVIDESEYGRDLQRKAQTSMGDVDSVDELTKRAREATAELGDEVLGEDVSYTVEVLFGDLPDDVLAKADELGCDHVFIAGEKRSPTGKVLFGDTTQSVLLNFDGPVTSLIG
ncbi:universal stress protein (plasmid) [Natrinema versiforme]|uniref:Universal stress protein n=2 Tax=Natrinema versiforme TaxID=88724 RepID=A0A4P8WNI9_9EURY|nr:universal stress protein [Natrinema versiforme]QCS44945.1 universal stress protein [Natrinema versiforme]